MSVSFQERTSDHFLIRQGQISNEMGPGTYDVVLKVQPKILKPRPEVKIKGEKNLNNVEKANA